MKFKKWIAVLLALMMLLSLLAGCSKKDDDDDDEDETTSTTAATDAGDETKPEKDPEEDPTKAPEKDPDKKPTKAPEKEEDPEDEPTKATKPAEDDDIGTIVDEPEVIVDTDDLEELYADVELSIDGETIDVVIGAVEKDDETVIYLEGEMESKYRAMIIDLSEDGELVIYSREKKSDAFKADDSLGEDDAEEALEVVGSILDMLLIEDWSDVCDELKKVKAANKNVYTYELLVDDEVAGTVSVDKKTGLVTELEVEDEDISMKVNDFSLTDAKIPSYTKAPEKEPEEDPTEATKPVEDDDVGTVLDEPEVLVDAEEINEFYADFEMTVGDITVNLAIGMEGILDEEGVIYLEGEMDSEYRAMIIEVGEDDEWVAYSRTKKSDSFKKDDSVTEDDVLEALGLVESMLETFVIEDWSDIGDELKKIESANKNVYTYEIVALDEVLGTVSVDKTTGIVTEMEMEGLSMKINDFSLTDAKIPTY